MERNELLKKVNSIVETIEAAERYKTVYSVRSAMTDLECALMQLNTVQELLNMKAHDEIIRRLFKAYALVTSAVSHPRIDRVKGASTLLMQAAEALEELIVSCSRFLSTEEGR